MALYDDTEYPLLEWAADRDVLPDPRCGTCWGDGIDADRPCRCLVDAVRAEFHQPAEECEPQPSCPGCLGDGEDDDGEICRCTLKSLRELQEELETHDA